MSDSDKDQEKQSNWKQFSDQFGNELSDYFSGPAPNENNELLGDIDLGDLEDGNEEETVFVQMDAEDLPDEPASMPLAEDTSSEEPADGDEEESPEDEASSDGGDNWGLLADTLGVESTDAEMLEQPNVDSELPARKSKDEREPRKATQKPSQPFGGFLSEEFGEIPAEESVAEQAEENIEETSAEILSEMFQPSGEIVEDDEPIQEMVDDTIQFDTDSEVSSEEAEPELEDETVIEDQDPEFLEFEVEDLYTEKEAEASRPRPERGRRRSGSRGRDDEGERPSRRRGRGRKRETEVEDSTSFGDDETVDAPIEEELESRTNRRRKRPRKKDTDRSEGESEGRTAETRSRNRNRSERDSETGSKSRSGSRKSQTAEKKFPTWSEAVTLIVDSNMGQRKKSSRPRKSKRRNG